MIPLVDVHAHLARPTLQNVVDDIIREAVQNNVKIIVVSVQNDVELKIGLELKSRYSTIIYLSIGQEITDFTLETYIKLTQNIEKLVRDRVVVAIGEVGLDYSKVKDRMLKNICRTIFEKWLELCKKYELPVIVHSHRAYRDVIEILQSFNISKVILHAYSGGIEIAKKAVDLGYYFSIPPSILHSKQKQKLVSNIPLENMLLESDTPELGPEFGSESRPVHVKLVVKKISEIKNVSEDEVSLITTRNFEKLFNIKVL